MVVHHNLDSFEMPFGSTKPQFEINQYVVVKNHMKEIKRNNNENIISNEATKLLQQNVKNKKRKREKSIKLEEKSSTSTADTSENLKTCSIDDNNVICESDLEELKSVYNKCKAIVKKIERKYGHLLDISEAESNPFYSQTNSSHDIRNEEKCTCSKKKKIIYDDDGMEITKESDFDKHICPKKLKSSSSKNAEKNILIEYEGNGIVLPDDLQCLSNMLHDPDLEITLRNKIIKKIKLIKNDYFNEIKFNKHALIENLKTNPEEVFEFKGANLSTLKGYP